MSVVVGFISMTPKEWYETVARIGEIESFCLNHIFLVFHGMTASELPTEQQDERSSALLLAKISVVQLKPVFTTTTIDIPKVYL